MVAERRGCDMPWHGSREHISERIDEQVVDHSRLEDARADTTKVLQQGTRGSEGQTYSRFQESSSVDWERIQQRTAEQIVNTSAGCGVTSGGLQVLPQGQDSAI